MKKSLLRRLPLNRGKGKFHAKEKPLILDITSLESFAEGSVIDINSLAKAGLVKLDEAKKYGVKILGKQDSSKKLDIKVARSNQ